MRRASSKTVLGPWVWRWRMISMRSDDPTASTSLRELSDTLAEPMRKRPPPATGTRAAERAPVLRGTVVATSRQGSPVSWRTRDSDAMSCRRQTPDARDVCLRFFGAARSSPGPRSSALGAGAEAGSAGRMRGGSAAAAPSRVGAARRGFLALRLHVLALRGLVLLAQRLQQLIGLAVGQDFLELGTEVLHQAHALDEDVDHLPVGAIGRGAHAQV